MIKQNTTYQKTFKTIFNETIRAGLDTLQRILTGYELPRGSLWSPTVTFTQPKNKTTYGYDHFRYQAHKGTGLYEQYTLDGKHYEMPWFSVPTGQPAVVQANISSPDTTFNADTIRFRSSLGMNIIPEPSPQDSVLYLSIQGRTHEQEQVIEAYIPYVDSTGTQQEKVIGKTSVITYNSTAHNLVVVPLNNATAPAGAVLEGRLNDIYKTSATEWVVSIDDPLDIPRTEWDTDDDGALDYEAFGRKYCKEMRRIYNYYEDKHSIDKNTYYLFLIPEPLKDDYVAYMPLKGQFAFISTGEVTQDELPHTLAHELGHGSFRLYHTFSDKNDYPVARGTTDNLMDYNNGSQLHKYQWDYIKDPRNMMFAGLKDEEEGAFIYGITWLGNYLWGLAPDDQESQIETDRALFKHVFENYNKYFNDSKTKNVNLNIEAHKSWTVRKASHQSIAKKIFKGVKEEKTLFSLHDEGIYFEEYTLEEETYKVAVYSKIEVVSLNQDIRIKSFKSLRYNKSIKVGYTKDYGLIVFYDADGKMQMVLQIIGGNTPKEAVIQWMNYLGLLLPSEEQQEEDKENSIQKMLNSVQLYALEKLNEIWGEKEVVEKDNIKISTEKILKDTKTATEIATKYTSGTACNICVRAALYIIKNDSALFPTTGSGYNDPKNNYISRKIKGYISPDGRAYYIKSDFNKLSSKPELNERFVEIPKNDQEEWVDYFQRLQNEAGKGTIIIGVMLNSTGNVGHIMMITPGGLIEINDKEKAWGKSFVSRGIKKVPRVLECGSVVRDNRAPLCRNVDRKGAIERLKWYKYKK